MSDGDNILGFFATFEHAYDESEEESRRVDEQSEQFRAYIWGKEGLAEKLGRLTHKNYGEDLKLALFQFSVFPSQDTIEHLKEIESYRSREKAIGIPVIVTKANFFDTSEADRQAFLRDTILGKLDLLAEVVKRKKLDTNISKLRSDVQEIL
jgi:hypothetical protein